MHTLGTRLLIFKLQQQVLKFNEIQFSQSSAKTNPEKNLFNLEKQSFENVSFSQ